MLRVLLKTAGDDERASRSVAPTGCATPSVRTSLCGGAPARAIHEVAGHQDLTTTQRYMHLTPGAVTRAIRLLEDPAPVMEPWRHHAGDDGAGDSLNPCPGVT